MIRLVVLFAVVALLVAAASVSAWLDPDYAGGREDTRFLAQYVAPVLALLIAWVALKVWWADREERDR